MKMVNKKDKICSFSGNVLAYLYDELSSEARERFETHLEGCSRCIDEFAELSEARYSVYEWKNAEFAPLATPRFVVPVENVPAPVSWIHSIKAAFAWNGAAAIAGVIAIFVIGVFGFVAVFNSYERPVAVSVEQPRPPVRSATSTVVPTENAVETAENEKPALDEPEVTSTAPPRNSRGTLVARSRTQSARTEPVRNSKADTVQVRRSTTTSRRLDTSPTLGQYVEDRDETLRLSDLFDDLDTRKLD